MRRFCEVTMIVTPVKTPSGARSGRRPFRDSPIFTRITSKRPTTVQRRGLSVARATFFRQGRQLFNFAHADDIGYRPTMEDACSSCGEFAGPDTQYYGLFDGHGGKEVASMCAEGMHKLIATHLANGEDIKNAIKRSFAELSRQATTRCVYAGSTAAVVVIKDNTIYAANAGDSRIILVDNENVQRMSFDHRASVQSERRLIIRRGGAVIAGRVNGILMVSRAIGDREVARYITSEPHITTAPLKPGMKLIIACDGVWDVMSDKVAAGILNRSRDPADAARAIKEEALKRGSTDNISVMIVDLKPL